MVPSLLQWLLLPIHVHGRVLSSAFRTQLPAARELFSSLAQLPAPHAEGPGLDILRDQVPELRAVRLEPVAYLGQQLLLDRLSSLVYLPVITEVPVGGMHGGQLEMAQAVQAVQRSQKLHLFGRVMGSGALQRVETPTASALFAAVDVQLRRHRRVRPAAWLCTCRGTVKHFWPRQRALIHRTEHQK